MAAVALIVLGVLVVVAAVITIHDSGRADPESASSHAAPAPAASRSTSRAPSTPPASSTSTATRHRTANPHGTAHDSGSTSKAPSAPSSSGSTSGSPTGPGSTTAGAGADASAKQVPIVVLNNTTVPGLATDAAAALRKDGWKVASVGNLVNNIISTCAYYDPSSPGAEDAAKTLQRDYPTIKRVEPKFAQLPSGPLVLVLTPGYQPI